MGINFSSIAPLSLVSWLPTRGRSRPVIPQMQDNSVAELTEAGTYQVANYGLDLIHTFAFKDLPLSDYSGGWDWVNKVQAAGTMSLVGFYFGVGRQLNQFTFTDESGIVHTVRFKDANFKPTDPDYLYVDITFTLVEEHYQ
ncbi:MAG: hypothetical protein WA666_02270 [Nitrospirota bacterium]